MGFDTRSGRFQYDETEDTDLDQQLRVVQGLYAMGLEIDHDYLYEKFGVKKSESTRRPGKDAKEGRSPDRPEKDAKEGRSPDRPEKDESNDADERSPDRPNQLAFFERFFAEGASRRR